MLRLPSLMADLLAGVLIFRAVQQREPGSQVELIVTGAYLFNLAIIYIGAKLQRFIRFSCCSR